ncbi:hypothetical protein L1987_65851 [Smallanthus sonchifolius]|uniref:Uncharacterized protein n=1 Tax=Smallanthus sonchifolius TaxID=185202 RepID=A0ACB9BVV2_9ASTR|nr:hypothetical protein L1987_65851 [Smallanthus sonchifolius]
MASKLTFLCILLFLFSLSKGDDTIKRFQGCKRGSKVQGLHEVKLYLAQFGYLNYQHTPNHVNPYENDEFDEELEVAVKDYQNFYHLNVTGKLDGPTISQMLMPHCGQPDKGSGYNPETKLLHIVSHYRFFPNSPRWPPNKRLLTYAIGSNYPSMYIPPVVSAFNKWSSATGYFTFSRTNSFTSADLKISWERGDHGDGYPFSPGTTVLAHAFAPTNGSQIQNAIMWSSIPLGTVKGLNSDDIQGIRALYGVNK